MERNGTTITLFILLIVSILSFLLGEIFRPDTYFAFKEYQVQLYEINALVFLLRLGAGFGAIGFIVLFGLVIYANNSESHLIAKYIEMSALISVAIIALLMLLVFSKNIVFWYLG